MNQPLTIQKARNLYNKGYIIENRMDSTIYPKIFQVLGYNFTTNKKRANKGRHYRIDNCHWYYQKTTLLQKLLLVITKQAVKIKD